MSETLRRRMAAADARMKAWGYEMPERAKSEREELSGLTFGQFRRKIARDMEEPQSETAFEELQEQIMARLRGELHRL